MSLNLRRETKCFISTVTSGFTNLNTWEVPVLADYSFSQGTGSETITLNEAGIAPKRGQRSFNISLEQAELSLPTYIRPYLSGTHNCVENILWEALVGAGATNENVTPGANFFQADFENSNVHELKLLNIFLVMENSAYLIDDAAVNTAEVDFNIEGIGMITWSLLGKTITTFPTAASPTDYPDPTTPGTTYLAVPVGANFIKNKLSTIELVKMSGTTSAYWIVDYNNLLDLTALTNMSDATAYTADITVDGGTLQTITIDPANIGGAANATVADFIAEMNNQIEGAIIYEKAGDLVIESSKSGAVTSMLVADGGVGFELLDNLDSTNFTLVGSATAGTGTGKSYTVPITGGNLSIENNITFLTPEELGKINTSIGHFTGTRAISGSVTCYLNTGVNNSEGLFEDLASDVSTVTHEFEMNLQVGGPVAPKVEFEMNHANLTIPAIQSEDVISLNVDFTALGNSITDQDELVVKYYAV